MLAARIKRNPARMYFAALLPLCKNLIMDGKLQGYYEVTAIHYKCCSRLTKLYPLQIARHAGISITHSAPPKTGLARVDTKVSTLGCSLRNKSAILVLHLVCTAIFARVDYQTSPSVRAC